MIKTAEESFKETFGIEAPKDDWKFVNLTWQQIKALMNVHATQFKPKETKMIEAITDRCQKEFHPVLMNWLSYKAQKNQRYKPIGLQTLVKKFNQFTGTTSELESIVEASIMNNYSGIIWSQKSFNNGKSTKPTTDEAVNGFISQ